MNYTGKEFTGAIAVQQVPVDDIIVVPGTYPRERIYSEWINHFSELFKGNSEYEPIKLLKIKGTGQYILIDGCHRLSGCKLAAGTTIDAVISPRLSFTNDQLKSRESKRLIKFLSALYNFSHGKKLSDNEKRDNIVDLYKMGTPLKQLYNLAPARTVRYYLSDVRKPEIEKKKSEIVLKKEKARQLLSNGESIRKVAKKTGLSTKTAQKIEGKLNNQEDKCSTLASIAKVPHFTGSNDKSGASPGDLKNSPGIIDSPTHPENSSISSGLPDVPDKSDIEALYDLIRKMKSTIVNDKGVDTLIIPLLMEKFQSVKKLIKDGYKADYHKAAGTITKLTAQIGKMKTTIDELKSDYEKQKTELKGRQQHCHMECEYSRERSTIERKYFLDSLREDLENALLMLSALNALSLNPSEQSFADINEIMKEHSRKDFIKKIKDFEIACPSTSVDTVSLKITASASLSADKRRASDAAYKFLSAVDYCSELFHDARDLLTRLSEFEEIVIHTEIFSADIKNRINAYRKKISGRLEEAKIPAG